MFLEYSIRRSWNSELSLLFHFFWFAGSGFLCTGEMRYLQLCFRSVSSWINRKSRCIILAFSSCFFSASGIYCGFNSEGPFASLILMSPVTQVSIAGLLFSRMFPLLLSILAMIYNMPGSLVAICSLKSFLFGLVFSSVSRLYGFAGWIVSFLLLFSDFVSLLSVHLFSFWHAGGFHSGASKDIRFLIYFVLFFVFMDLAFVSPFLLSVFKS